MAEKTLKSHRPHIGIFGRRNFGKSSFINAFTKEDVAIVSDFAGTTTDPVQKILEVTDIGPAVLIDTAGIDDVGDIGEKRVKKSFDVIKKINLAILIITDNTFGKYEKNIINEFERYNTPFFIVYNKSDLNKIDEKFKQKIIEQTKTDVIEFSCIKNSNIEEVAKTIKKYLPKSVYNNPSILGDLVSYGDIVLLITPIDAEAPRGRLILPQVQTIRDCLDNECITVVLKERELETYWKKINVKPKIVVTDSQVFLKADASIPKDVPLTSFSILFARMKGNFEKYLEGTPKISKLKENSRILILESCSHHVSCDDIGRVKIPRWLSNFTGKKLNFDVVAGLDPFPRKIKDYSLVIQCGGCMLTRIQVLKRLQAAIENNIPITNYGMTISYIHGIYNRAVAPFIKENQLPEDYL